MTKEENIEKINAVFRKFSTKETLAAMKGKSGPGAFNRGTEDELKAADGINNLMSQLGLSNGTARTWRYFGYIPKDRAKMIRKLKPSIRVADIPTVKPND